MTPTEWWAESSPFNSIAIPDPAPFTVNTHILSIDDEDIIRELITEFLEAYDYRVTGVRNPTEALKVAQSDPPALIITDLQLEDSDGLQLVEKLQEFIPDAPVILLTGVLFDARTVDEKLSGKISAYVSKTAPLETLLKEVHRLLGDS